MNKFTRLIFMCSLSLLLASCINTPIAPQYEPRIDYSQMDTISLDVSEVLVINDGSTTKTTEKFAHKFGDTPESALNEWAKKRMEAVGKQGSFSLIIKDANLTARALEVDRGVGGWFKNEQSEEWSAYLNVLMAIEGSEQMLPPAETTIAVRAFHSVPENASSEELDRIYDNLLNELITAFNKEAEKQMQAYFRAYFL